MKHINQPLLFILFALTFVACNHKKTEQQSPMDLPAFVFTESDTTSIQRLASEFVALVDGGLFDSAADMLYVVRNDSVLPLTEDQRTGYIHAMRAIPLYGCSLKELNLFSNRDNELRISLQIAEEGNPETGEGCTSFFLNPVEKDGVWYLTLRDKYAEGVGLYHPENQ